MSTRHLSLLPALVVLGCLAHARQGAGADIIPPERRTTWNPGLNAVGGIPYRTTIYRTISPSGGDDTAAIQAALDGCPANQVVKLTVGTFNITGNGLSFRTSNCTLRGSGTGTAGSGAGGTRLVKADRNTNANYGVLYLGTNAARFASSTNLASDVAKGANSLTLVSNPGLQVGEIVLIDQITNNHPDVWWGPEHEGPGGGSRRWFCRQDRSLAQMMEVTAVNGNTITFSTPFHFTFKTAYTAQLSRYAEPVLHRTGVEDLYVYGGMGGDYNGNVSVNLAAYCWIKNIESHWSVGTSVGFYGTFRSELRDSYIHETPDPNPGGAGYLTGVNFGASDNLIENNIMWYGNKVVVMRASGGGNVFAYNYTDDAFGSYYPSQPEAGINAGHYTTPHMELLEGNYSHNYKGDSFWGNSIYITAFRNHFSGLRGAHPPLDTYKYGMYPYKDLHGRTAVDIQANSYGHNLVGNVLGFSGQTLLSYNQGGLSYTQTSWLYEKLDGFPEDGVVPMWAIGSLQAGGWRWVASTHQTILRDGNWDWSTRSQQWHDIGGAAGAGTPKTLPDSLYRATKPAFFGSNPWPWVDPSTGTVHTLPAKARFESFTIGRHTLTVAKAGTGTGTVTSSPAGINCGADCSEPYNRGIVVSLTATPATGSLFAGWSGACSGTIGCQITMDAARSVTASFSTASGPPPPGDFNRDGSPDLLWHNQASGLLYVWLLVNSKTVGGSYLTPDRFADTRWQIRGVVDFNNDGQTDILWHHQTKGDLYVWLMNGMTAVSGTYLTPSRFADTNWQIRGLAHFNADGQIDILWHHQKTGDLYVWFMSGATAISGSYLTPSRFADTNWQIRGLADFNGDGKADVLWHHQKTGDLYVWLMNGTTAAAGSYLTPPRFADTRWQIVRVADFNGDGQNEVLWHHQQTGDLYVWYLNGVVTVSGGYLTPSRFADTTWKIAPK